MGNDSFSLGVNWTGVLLGGLVAGLILVGFGVLDVSVSEWDLAPGLENLNRTPLPFTTAFQGAGSRVPLPFLPLTASISVLGVVLELIIGFWMLWLYATISLRYGVGPKTAVMTGVASWLMIAVVTFSFASMAGAAMGSMLSGLGFYLVTILVAATVGSLLYKDTAWVGQPETTAPAKPKKAAKAVKPAPVEEPEPAPSAEPPSATTPPEPSAPAPILSPGVKPIEPPVPASALEAPPVVPTASAAERTVSYGDGMTPIEEQTPPGSPPPAPPEPPVVEEVAPEPPEPPVVEEVPPAPPEPPVVEEVVPEPSEPPATEEISPAPPEPPVVEEVPPAAPEAPTAVPTASAAEETIDGMTPIEEQAPPSLSPPAPPEPPAAEEVPPAPSESPVVEELPPVPPPLAAPEPPVVEEIPPPAPEPPAAEAPPPLTYAQGPPPAEEQAPPAEEQAPPTEEQAPPTEEQAPPVTPPVAPTPPPSAAPPSSPMDAQHQELQETVVALELNIEVAVREVLRIFGKDPLSLDEIVQHLSSVRWDFGELHPRVATGEALKNLVTQGGAKEEDGKYVFSRA